MRQTILLFAFVCSSSAALLAQNNGARLFLDVPSLFFVAPDVENIGTNLGVGGAIAMNVATHNVVGRVGGGSNFTFNPKISDFKESFSYAPFVMAEAGAGMYRSNGDLCAKTKRNAYTVLGKAGARYIFDTSDLRTADAPIGAMDYNLGVELGYFYIRDVFKNFELVLDGNYFVKSKTVSATFGFKVFLNLKANR